jgi:hypothetical protein
MIVSVRDITARCRECGGSNFNTRNGAEPKPDTVMACSGCGARTSYRELLDQIGEEAMKRANQAIAELKKKSGRPRKPRK